MSGINPGPDPKTIAPTARFRPIAEYGLLADCNAAALVDRDGSISWLCVPRYDSPAVFARILDPAARSWPPRQRRYRKPWVESATGTTDTPGFATPA
jgi:hypothetical protein